MWLGLTLQWRAGSCWNADAFKICIARRNLCWRLYNALLTCGTALQINPLTHLLSCSFAPSFSPLVFYFLQKFFTTHGTHPSIINSPPVLLSSLPWTVFPLPIYPHLVSPASFPTCVLCMQLFVTTLYFLSFLSASLKRLSSLNILIFHFLHLQIFLFLHLFFPSFFGSCFHLTLTSPYTSNLSSVSVSLLLGCCSHLALLLATAETILHSSARLAHSLLLFHFLNRCACLQWYHTIIPSSCTISFIKTNKQQMNWCRKLQQSYWVCVKTACFVYH